MGLKLNWLEFHFWQLTVWPCSNYFSVCHKNLPWGLKQCIDNSCFSFPCLSLPSLLLITVLFLWEILFHNAKCFTGMGIWSKKVQTESYQWNLFLVPERYFSIVFWYHCYYWEIIHYSYCSFEGKCFFSSFLLSNFIINIGF